MLIPSVVKRNIADAALRNEHPMMDYFMLQEALGADIIDYSSLESEAHPRLVRLAQRAGRDTALAALGYTKRNEYDVIFSNGENVSIPLSFFFKGHRKRPVHVLIGHRVSPRKKRPFFKLLHPQMDAIFLYSSTQLELAVKELGIPVSKLHLIPFHADSDFYRPTASSDASRKMICSAGLEWRDYPTLIEAVTGMDVEVCLAAASPWSKHKNETEKRMLPPNVSAKRYEYKELRKLYSDSRFVVVPLYENDFQAGITTILEGMSMGKAIITSKTSGQIDTIRHGENGLYVPPGDPVALREAILHLLDRPDEAARMGAQARLDIEKSMSLRHWASRISGVIRSVNSVQALV